MTPDELSESRKQSVKKGRLTVKRRLAWSQRKDQQPKIKMSLREGSTKQPGGEKKDDQEDNEIEDEDMQDNTESEEEDKKVCESVKTVRGEVVEEGEKSDQDKETAPKGEQQMSGRSWRRYSKSMKNFINTFDKLEQVEIFIGVVNGSKSLDEEKLGFSFNKEKKKELRNMSKLTEYQLRARVRRLRRILQPARDPEELLQALLKQLLANPTQLSLLEEAGLQVLSLLSV